MKEPLKCRLKKKHSPHSTNPFSKAFCTMMLLPLFLLHSMFNHGSGRVRPWFNHVFNANTLHIQPNIHAYITHLYKYVVYT